MNRFVPIVFAGLLASTGAFAATVTVQPPSYSVAPPKFTFTLPDTTKGTVGPAGPAGPAADLSGITSRLDSLESAVKALQAGQGSTAGTPAPSSTPSAALTDPCQTLSGGKWDALTVDNTMSIASALNCANPKFHLTLKAGLYNQVFHVPDGLDGWDIGGVSADTVKLSGQGGCTVSDNNAGGCATKLAYRKGVIHVSSAGTIHDLEVKDGGSNANGNHDGQAGIYIDAGAAGGTITITHVMLRHNENGVFSNGNTILDLVLTEDDFVNNGTDGGSHSSYLGGGKSVTYNNIHDYGSTQGNNAKSRIPVVTFNGGFSKSVQGRWIEAADGATMTINGGQFVGNNCCQNQFGNGTESTNKGPGNTVWHGPSDIWIFRNTDFANAGSFQADPNVTLHMCGSGPNPFNDKGGALNGWTVDGACTVQPPADPPFISGARS